MLPWDIDQNAWINSPNEANMIEQISPPSRVNLLDPSTRMSSGFVGLGDFVPYAKVGR